MNWTTEEISEINRKLEGMHAADRVAWAFEHFGEGLILSTSFGIQSAVMLHLVTRQIPDISVVFIDTGYLFKETYLFARELELLLNLNLKKYQPRISAAEHEALYGQQWSEGKDALEAYNNIRKVEPMNRALTELKGKAWLAGLRQGQSDSRKKLEVLHVQKKIFKFHPIVDWTDRDVYLYLKKHDLPYHPLWEEGYVSVGDTHSTKKLLDGMRPEDTRFNGLKRECGLHEVSDRSDFQI